MKVKLGVLRLSNFAMFAIFVGACSTSSHSVRIKVFQDHVVKKTVSSQTLRLPASTDFCSGLFSASENESGNVISNERFARLFQREKARWIKLKKAFEIQVGSEKISADYYLGHGSAFILLDSNQGKILKGLPIAFDFIGKFESLATEYLLENNEKVPEIFASEVKELEHLPSELHDHPGTYMMTVKKYFEGVTSETLPVEEAPELSQIAERIRNEHFSSNRFSHWLQDRDPQLLEEIRRYAPRMLTTGDVKPANFIYMRDLGWVLNDP